MGRIIVSLIAIALTVVVSTMTAMAAEPPAAVAEPGAHVAYDPSTTLISGAGGSFLATVDGAPEPFRGMGYNAILGGLSDGDRAAILARDMELMRIVGVNLIVGWDQKAFDRVFLNAAHAEGIGVAMHFELGKGRNYSDPDLRQRLLDEIAVWVETYRDHPAVRMWGIGNEVLLTTSDEECRAFAEFFVQAYQVARERDPNHPVLYREAEDVRVGYFRDAFAAAGVAPDQFIVGMNFYTPRIAEVLAAWPDHAFDVPVLISEFAPAGGPPSSRAEGFRAIWGMIVPHEQFVLGATPYVWTTEGPEAVDRIFGLTDGNGDPVDEAVFELQRLYRGGAAQPESLPPIAPRSTDGLHMSIAAATAQLLAKAVVLSDLETVDIDAVRARAREFYGADIAAAPGYATADKARVARMLDILADTAVLAALRQQDAPVYSGAVEALPLLAGMARWSTIDPRAADTAEAFIGEVLAQALRTPLSA
ncbi:MAG: hypothetical protein EPO26_15670 [Chloroflexota bacterium]|nr:MAG: hypothetical protein EPO26_15670 [Chloroflexota bacterium]